MPDNDHLLKIKDLKTYFPIRKGLLRKTVGHVRAVDGVSFAIEPGRTLGLVGESGCGKTTVARSIVRLVPATAGEIIFDGKDILKADKAGIMAIRRRTGIVFQDPYGCLNPRMTVRDIVSEPMKVQGGIAAKQSAAKTVELLERVGLSEGHLNRYPHEFSGGQRQRIGIARALALRPALVICDEPVSALDVSIRSQILNLLKDLQDQFGLTYLFIAHDLAVVEFFCDFVAVMYMGRIVEYAARDSLYEFPSHPYTRLLMSAIPVAAPGRRKRPAPEGEVPDLLRPPSGCTVRARCPLASEKCSRLIPPLEDIGGGHLVACWHAAGSG